MFYAYVVSVYIVLPLVTLTIYFIQSVAIYPQELLLGIVLNTTPGIFLYYWFMSQFITGSRVKLIEKTAGLPAVIRTHIATTAGILVLLAVHGFLHGVGSVTAIIGLGAAIVIISLYIIAIALWSNSLISKLPGIRTIKALADKKLRYKHFRRIHNINAIAAMLVFWHVLRSAYVEDSLIVATILIAFFSVSFGSYIYHKLIRPFVLKKRIWEVRGIVPENDSITTLTFAQLSGPPLLYKAGQFGFFQFISGPLKHEEHPFSFSSSPHAKNISITVQKEGEFTSRLRTECAVGERMVCDAPYGSFCIDEKKLFSHIVHNEPYTPITFVSGGIGIVPFLGIVEDIIYASSQNKAVSKDDVKDAISLFWLTANSNDIFGKKVLKKAQRLVDTHLYSRRNNTFITEEAFINTSQYRFRNYYICASHDVTQEVIRILRGLGVDRKNISYELFSL